MEYKVAKKLFEIAQIYLPWRDKKKLSTWEELPDSVKSVWVAKATEVINIVEEYCPFSPKHQIG